MTKRPVMPHRRPKRRQPSKGKEEVALANPESIPQVSASAEIASPAAFSRQTAPSAGRARMQAEILLRYHTVKADLLKTAVITSCILIGLIVAGLALR